MKILFIRPPDVGLGKFKNLASAQHPINLVYLATYVKPFHSANILDLQANPMNKQELVLYIKDQNPDAIGITFMTCNFNSVKEITNMAKKLNKTVILGGPHPTILPEQTLQEINADIIILGEGEITLKETLDALEKNKSLRNIKGLSYRKGNKIIHNQKREYIQTLDDLKIPDRTMLDLKAYFGGSTPGITKNSTVMFTSRGCPFPCIFCSARLIHGRNYRMRSMDNIFEEINEIVSLGFKHITIDDDTFTLNQDRVSEFCDKIKSYNITWDCDSRVGLPIKLLEKMKKSGCEKIAFGVESGSQRILDVIKKNINIEEITKTFQNVHKAGIKTQAFFMVGHPTENQQDIKLTLKLIKKIKPTWLFLSLVTPYPGTPLYEHMLKKGFVSKNADWSKFTFFGEKAVWRNECFTGEQLIKIRNSIYRKFYISPEYIFSSLLNVRTIKDMKYLMQGAKSLLSFLKK